MLDEDVTNALNLPIDIRKSSALSLSRSINIIGQWFDVEARDVNRDGYTRDWRGLAMLMGFDQQDIRHWESLPEKTKLIINKWAQENACSDTTVENLLKYIETLRCIHLLTSINFIKAITDDVKKSKKRQEQRIEEELEIERIKQEDEKVRELRRQTVIEGASLKEPTLKDLRPEFFSKDAKNELVLGDKPYFYKTFDALICYAIEDILFVKRMLKKLETDPFKLTLCVDERDFIVGSYRFTLTARVMEERCKRIVLIMSPDFIRTPMCEFQTEYALSITPGSANKKILPLMYRPCDVPSGLKHIAGLYYTKDELKEWFWPRLGGSLGSSLQWNEDEDHQRSDWGTISMPFRDSSSVSRETILTTKPQRRKVNPSGRSSSSVPGSSSSTERSGSPAILSVSSSSISSMGSTNAAQGVVQEIIENAGVVDHSKSCDDVVGDKEGCRPHQLTDAEAFPINERNSNQFPSGIEGRVDPCNTVTNNNDLVGAAAVSRIHTPPEIEAMKANAQQTDTTTSGVNRQTSEEQKERTHYVKYEVAAEQTMIESCPACPPAASPNDQSELLLYENHVEEATEATAALNVGASDKKPAKKSLLKKIFGSKSKTPAS